jgi:hypothetical protein
MEAVRRLASLGISNEQHRKVLRGLWGAQKQHHPSESPTLSIGFSSDDHRSANDDDVKGADRIEFPVSGWSTTLNPDEVLPETLATQLCDGVTMTA